MANTTITLLTHTGAPSTFTDTFCGFFFKLGVCRLEKPLTGAHYRQLKRARMLWQGRIALSTGEPEAPQAEVTTEQLYEALERFWVDHAPDALDRKGRPKITPLQDVVDAAGLDVKITAAMRDAWLESRSGTE